jgi:16S rRNA processing protein RimM
VARITRTQGLKGAVRVDLALDDDRLWQPNRRLIICSAAGDREVEIEFFRRQHGHCVLKIRGIDSITDAEEHVGAELRIRRNDLLPPTTGSYYTFQLKGCSVYVGGENIGTVTDVLELGGTDILQVDRGGEETLIPFAHSYLRKIDVTERRIDVELPEGLRELNK